MTGRRQDREPLRSSDIRAAFYLILTLFTISFMADLAIKDLEVPGIIYTLAPMPLAYAFASRYLPNSNGNRNGGDNNDESSNS